MTILPITYLGGIEWFRQLIAGDCVIDIGENWVKQTARNRCEIMTSGGVATLVVPVHASAKFCGETGFGTGGCEFGGAVGSYGEIFGGAKSAGSRGGIGGGVRSDASLSSTQRAECCGEFEDVAGFGTGRTSDMTGDTARGATDCRIGYFGKIGGKNRHEAGLSAREFAALKLSAKKAATNDFATKKLSAKKLSTKDVRIDNSRPWQHQHWISLVSAYKNSPFFDHYEERFAPVFSKKFDFLVDLNLELLDILIVALRLENRVQISEDYIIAQDGDIDFRGKKSLRRSENSAPEGPKFGHFGELGGEHNGGRDGDEGNPRHGKEENFRVTRCGSDEDFQGNTSRSAVGQFPGKRIPIEEGIPKEYIAVGKRQTSGEYASAAAPVGSGAPVRGGGIHMEYTQVFSDKTPFVSGLSVVDLLFCEGPTAREFLYF
jgi:hypothetical protein